MAVQMKPLYLATSMEQLEQMIDMYEFIPTNLAECYLSANLAWFAKDQEKALLLYSRVAKKLNENSILNNEQISEFLERLVTLKEILKNRYDKMKREKENTINEFHTIYLDNVSPNYDECWIKSLFSKYGEIKKIWFNVDVERSLGLIEYAEQNSALNAIKEENGKNCDGQNIIVEHFADKFSRFHSMSEQKSNASSSHDYQSTRRTNGNKLLIMNMLNDYKREDEIRSLFSIFGEIKNVQIFKFGEADENGFVIIEFMHVLSAANAYMKMSSFEMPSGESMHIILSKDDKIEEKREAFECENNENTAENYNTDCVSSGASGYSKSVRTLNANDVDTRDNRSIRLTNVDRLLLLNVLNDYKTEHELRTLFSSFGEISNVHIFPFEGEERKGFVVLEFMEVVNAIKACVKMSFFKMPSGELMHINFCAHDVKKYKLKALNFKYEKFENATGNYNTDFLSNGISGLNTVDRSNVHNNMKFSSDYSVEMIILQTK
ncbi:pre-mRNA splicing factor (Prp24)-like protein [Leptotrombidium deliense]|uniref:Pre-mRNA splicing factor (Prp24)-like protein n=1 Tax=Leptotrombidium deliense TaxID=299467 RepID=A0A443S7V5_9ACAR|nr:pre-mRNA splicing factor (Prp24)-like protein [Leptotrombidium deliense]